MPREKENALLRGTRVLQAGAFEARRLLIESFGRAGSVRYASVSGRRDRTAKTL